MGIHNAGPTLPLNPDRHAQFKEKARDGIDAGEAIEASLSARSSAQMPGVADVFEVEEKGKKVRFAQLALTETSKLPENSGEYSKRALVKGTTMTIDDYDTQDLDDGLSFRKNDDGTMTVGVSVADVAAWVRPGSALDHAARKRVNSQYIHDMVVPMLPLPLSEDLLSLHGGQRRLAKTVEMTFSPDGELLGTDIQRTVFYNANRLNTGDAEKIRQSDYHGHQDLKSVLNQMCHLAAKVKSKGECGEKDSSSVKRMLETFITQSCKALGHELAEAGISTSYRNQVEKNTKSTYDAEPLGHVSVGAEAYVQWTSPIRRYADLDVHRAMGRLIDGKGPREGRVRQLDQQMRNTQLERANKGPGKSYRFVDLLVDTMKANQADSK
jgi:exoribonuclease R